MRFENASVPSEPTSSCAKVETSTGNHSACDRRYAFSVSSTTPGCTTALAPSRSTRTMRLRYLLVSMTSAAPTAWLHGDLQRDLNVALGPRHHHAGRVDMVDRGVGRVAAAACRIEQDFALDLAGKAPRERT